MKLKSNSTGTNLDFLFGKIPYSSQSAYLVKGARLHPLDPPYPFRNHTFLKKVISTKELKRLVIRNKTILLGNQFVFGSIPKSWRHFAKWTNVPDYFILCKNGSDRLTFYFLDFIATDQDFFEFTFIKLSQLYLTLSNNELRSQLSNEICRDYKTPLMDLPGGNQSPIESINDALLKPSAALVSGDNFSDLLPVKDLYPTWQRISFINFKSFVCDKNWYCSFTPSFSSLSTPHEPVLKLGKIIPSEGSHFERASPEVREMYLHIKNELLQFNGALKFYPQRYYIGLTNDRSHAFFIFRRNKIDLVVRYPEKETRRLLKHHEILTLKKSIQKFWGAPACSILIESPIQIQEITELLKIILEK